jgi:hypothetical protein|nr:MAG TPA: hypothetical protein [Caudoviricetes sp.]
MHQSVATIDSPEFINLQPLDINPLMSKCEIKVLYIGENRNHSFITKDVATEMSKTLRGAPIVGYYKEENQDFRDHGDQIIIDEKGIQFKCLTKPYGFVSPDAEVWFQKFEDTDDFGNKIVREYLMTTGFLWTGQFEEAKLAIEQGRPHSMELDKDTLDGYWSENVNTKMELFIVNDAIFSKLCILGDDVEPCFEGSSVTAPNVSTNFSKVDDNFKQTLFSMMQDLKFALEGGNMAKVDEEKKDKTNETVENKTDKTTEEVKDIKTEKDNKDKKKNYTKEDKKEEDKKEDNPAPAEDKKLEEKKEETKTPAEDKKEEEKEKKDKKDYALMYSELETKYNDLSAKYESLVAFKQNVEKQQKEELIGGFYMLSDEDKKDVVAHIDEYSLDDIEAKLSVICVRKKVNFDLDDTSKNENKTEEENPVTTFNLENAGDSVPAWIKAIQNHK